jgi:hypothetical protein
MEFDGKVTFKPGPSQGSLDFGFFQLGRQFETYRAVYTRSGNTTKPNLKVDETQNMRTELPAQDHAKRFFTSKPHTLGDAAKNVSVKFSDKPQTPFQAVRPFNSVDFRLSGVSVESFFFTGFGLVKSGRALLLATQYWTIRYCEELSLSADLSKDGTKKVPVKVTPERDCRTHGCDLGEPGARDAANNAPGWGNGVDLAKTYVVVANQVAATARPKGPDKFNLDCGS